jgi:hypothetical protein
MLVKRAVVSGEQLTNANVTFDQNGQPPSAFRFNGVGARASARPRQAKHRQALRHRPRQEGDLGAGDQRHHRRLGHHHRQLHDPERQRTSPPAAAAPCRPR